MRGHEINCCPFGEVAKDGDKTCHSVPRYNCCGLPHQKGSEGDALGGIIHARGLALSRTYILSFLEIVKAFSNVGNGNLLQKGPSLTHWEVCYVAGAIDKYCSFLLVLSFKERGVRNALELLPPVSLNRLQRAHCCLTWSHAQHRSRRRRELLQHQRATTRWRWPTTAS